MTRLFPPYVLPLNQRADRYEMALVGTLPEAVSSEIQRLRRRLLIAVGGSAPQLPPHLTILYLGIMSPSEALRTWAHMAAFRHPSVCAEVGSVGTFKSGAHIVNLHVRIEPIAQLQILHDAARIHYESLPWAISARRSAHDFVPHVSILDGVHLREPVPHATVAPAAWRFDDLRLMAQSVYDADGHEGVDEPQS